MEGSQLIFQESLEDRLIGVSWRDLWEFPRGKKTRSLPTKTTTPLLQVVSQIAVTVDPIRIFSNALILILASWFHNLLSVKARIAKKVLRPFREWRRSMNLNSPTWLSSLKDLRLCLSHKSKDTTITLLRRMRAQNSIKTVLVCYQALYSRSDLWGSRLCHSPTTHLGKLPTKILKRRICLTRHRWLKLALVD